MSGNAIDVPEDEYDRCSTHHLQLSAGTEKPLMIGPMAGPQVAARAQRHSIYGSLISEYMS